MSAARTRAARDAGHVLKEKSQSFDWDFSFTLVRDERLELPTFPV
jgi:hypothetical protein